MKASYNNSNHKGGKILFSLYILFLLYANLSLLYARPAGATFQAQNYPQDNSEALNLFEQAMGALTEKRDEKAKKILEELIFNHPKSPQTPKSYLFLGDIYDKNNLFYEAEAIYCQFMKQYPKHHLLSEILFRQGEIFLHMGEIKKSCKVFKQLILEFPKTIYGQKALFKYADSLKKLNDEVTARIYYLEGMKVLPDYINSNPETAFNVGCLYFREGLLEKALKVFSNLEKNSPNNTLTSQALAFCGDIYKEQGKLQEALQTYQKVITNFPETIGAQVSTIRMADLSTETNKKIKDPNYSFPAFHKPILAYKNLIEKKSTEPSLAHLAEYKLALDLQKNGKYREAITLLKSILKKGLEKKIYHRILSSLKEIIVTYLNYCYEKEDFFSVIKIYEKNKLLLASFLQKPKNISYFFNIAQSYQKKGFDEKAKDMYEKMFIPTIDSKFNNQILFELAHIHFHKQKYKKALGYLQKIDTNANRTLVFKVQKITGDIHFQEKNFKKAVEAYKTAKKTESEDINIKLLLSIGESLDKLKNTSEAMRYFKKAINFAQKKEELAQGHLKIADLHYRHQNYAQALVHYQELQKLPLEPDDRDWALFQIANCSQKEKKSSEATDSLEKLKSSHSDPIWASIADFKDFCISLNQY